MPSFTNNTSTQTCTSSNLPEKMVKKMTVFGKQQTSSILASSINSIRLPKGVLYPSGVIPSKFPNMVNG
jgi:hypothetical protein